MLPLFINIKRISMLNMLMPFIKSALMITIFSQLISCNFAPGSYPYAEKYEINVSEPALIEAIQKFKEDNPEYKVPEQTQLIDGRRDSKDHWYHVYFYYSDEEKIVYTWTRPADRGKTIFAFISINNGLELGRWKDINTDLNYAENKKEKAKFEESILNNIKKYLE